ncbi:hypothetical protein COL516b_006827 [Colletotrichum fioriniae]|nr:uncharacterized protein COL516b_006827 [Colletotrichum fioriniae]KAJ0302790.1 hypothetical protein COL516b_006827 [Colletotrichum fioriniae]
MYGLSRGPMIRWYKKVSFSDREFHRRTYKVGDYVEFNRASSPDDGNMETSDTEDESQLGRIDGVFLHKHDQTGRAFLVLTKATISEDDHPHLGLPYVDDDREQIIIGLLAIDPLFKGQYIIDDCVVEGQETRQLWVTWDVKLI